MITEEQLEIWIRSKGCIPAWIKEDTKKIKELLFEVDSIGNTNINLTLYFYYYTPNSLMWLSDNNWGFDNSKILKTTISDIISEVRDHLISKLYDN